MHLVQDIVLGVVVMMVLEMLATYMLITFLVEPYKSTRRVYSYPYFTEERGAQGALVVGPLKNSGPQLWSFLLTWWFTLCPSLPSLVKRTWFCGHCGTEAAVWCRGIPWDHMRPLGCPWRWTWLVGRCAGKGGGRTVSPPPSSQARCYGGSPRFLGILG